MKFIAELVQDVRYGRRLRRFFAKTFGSHKLKGGEELTTVAKNLALRTLEN